MENQCQDFNVMRFGKCHKIYLQWDGGLDLCRHMPLLGHSGLRVHKYHFTKWALHGYCLYCVHTQNELIYGDKIPGFLCPTSESSQVFNPPFSRVTVVEITLQISWDITPTPTKVNWKYERNISSTALLVSSLSLMLTCLWQFET